MKSNKIKEFADNALIDLFEKLNADLLTCYIRNSSSDIYWLYSHLGEFKYPEFMKGPLTHKHQVDRILYDINKNEHYITNYYGEKFNKNIPDDFSEKILYGTPFFNRESVTHIIRIIINYNKDTGFKGYDTQAVIFINYSEKLPIEKVHLECVIKNKIILISDLLFELCKGSILDEEDLINIQSLILSLQSKFGSTIICEKDSWEKLYEEIVEETVKIVNPNNNGKNIVCTLNKVDRNNIIQLLYCNNKSIEIPQNTNGIVDYVARTGQILLIENKNEYNIKISDNNSLYPKFLDLKIGSISEVTLPLIVQGKVVGVINLESNESNAYNMRHIQMLMHISRFAATVVRQILFYEDLNICINTQHDLMHDNSIIDDEKFIYNTIIKRVNELGFYAAIWDFKEDSWYRDPQFNKIPTLSKPRKKGNSNWINENPNKILVLANLRFKNSDSKELTCDHKIGELDCKSKLFLKWTNYSSPNLPLPHKDLADYINTIPAVATSIGIPIFSFDNEGNECIKTILWATCKRYFTSLLSDEIWSVSLICRSVHDVINFRKTLLHSKEEKNKPINDEPIKMILKYHFSYNSDKVFNIIKSKGDLLNASKYSNILVFNIDIRGSTAFSINCDHHNKLTLFSDFINDYHNKTIECLYKYGAVIDKTMGDGIQAFFNIYDNIIDIDKPIKFQLAIENSVLCVLEIYQEFMSLIKSYTFKFGFDRNFGLGFGLTIGDSIIGSTQPINFKELDIGFDYTIYGSLANISGKLVSAAKLSNVIEWVNNSDPEIHPVIKIQKGPPRKLTLDEINSLQNNLKRIEHPCVILTNKLNEPTFEQVILKHPDKFEGYIIEPNNDIFEFFNRVILILLKNNKLE